MFLPPTKMGRPSCIGVPWFHCLLCSPNNIEGHAKRGWPIPSPHPITPPSTPLCSLHGIAAGAGGVQALVESKGLVQISDPAALEAMVDAVLEANPTQLEQYRAGKTKLQGYFVGQLMKESKGRANPTELNKILMKKLNSKD